MSTTEPVMTMWRSPSTRLHHHQTCSGAGPVRRVRRVRVTLPEFNRARDAGMVCRCVQSGWKADEAS